MQRNPNTVYYDWADDVECLDKAGPGTSGGFGSVGVYEAIIVSVICMLLCLVRREMRDYVRRETCPV